MRPTPAREPTRVDCLADLRAIRARIEATGSDTTRRPENVGDLICVQRLAMRVGLSRCIMPIVAARRALEYQGDVPKTLRCLDDALRAVEAAVGEARAAAA